MRRQRDSFVGAAFLLHLSGTVFGIGAVVAAAEPLPVAQVHFEQNATDGDVEVVFNVKGGDEGLAKLTVISPDGRTVIAFSAPDDSTLGIRQLDFESPEPKDVAELKAAYPEGVYTFSAATAAGAEFSGKSTLSHTLPTTTRILYPSADADAVSVRDVKVSWAPVRGISCYLVEVKERDSGMNVFVKLPNSATLFALPEGFLSPGKRYQLSIGTMTSNGNISFVEIDFTTATSR